MELTFTLYQSPDMPRSVTGVSLVRRPLLLYEVPGPVRKFTLAPLILPAVPLAGVGVGVTVEVVVT